MHEARAGQLQNQVYQLEQALAERDDLIFTLRQDVATLGAQVKQVNIDAGGNTTTNRILSPGGTSDPLAAPGDAAPVAVPLWAKLLALIGLGFFLYKLKR